MFSTSLSLKALASLISLVSVVNGHMIMKTPIPYGRGTINNSPLDASGSDFPCKNIFTMTDPVADINHMTIGESQTLSFTGSAVHGGGSCQVSLSTDLVPTKNSKWMVIKSIEGGCPADVAGNLAENANGNGASTFQYTVPQGVAAGQYTIAWTWVNKVGNREFYMNCGRADITAAKKKRYAPAPKPGMSKRATSFPDLFVANIAGVSNGCATVENFDTEYPNPGQDVVKSSDGKFGPPSGCSGSVAAGAGSASSSVAGAAPSVAASSVVASYTASYTATGSPTVSSGSIPGVFASGAASQSSAVATSAPTVAASSSSMAVVPVASTATVVPVPAASTGTPSSSSSGSTTSQTQGTACSSEGDWLCAADGKSFQRCASGMWSASMPMAAGMTCTPGESATIQMNTIGSRKRSVLGKHGNIHHRRSLPVVQS